jgi:hypothetical protein
MKKIVMFIFVSFGIFALQLQGISLEQYIVQYGIPHVQNGVLDLSYRNLTDLEGLQNITNINQVISLVVSNNRLGDNPLRTVSSSLLHDLPHLKDLDLSNNHLQWLPATVFDSLPNLRLLDLGNNQLHDLPASVFSSLSNLHTLVLADNRLTILPSVIFKGLHNLQMLILENNQLRALPATIFDTLYNLQKLYLGGNQLQKLPSTVFNTVNNLQILDVNHNAFTVDFMAQLASMVQNIPHLVYFNGKPKSTALHYFPFVTLKQVILTKIAQNIDVYRYRLHELPSEILDVLPLTPAQRAGIAAEKRQSFL